MPVTVCILLNISNSVTVKTTHGSTANTMNTGKNTLLPLYHDYCTSLTH